MSGVAERAGTAAEMLRAGMRGRRHGRVRERCIRRAMDRHLRRAGRIFRTAHFCAARGSLGTLRDQKLAPSASERAIEFELAPGR